MPGPTMRLRCPHGKRKYQPCDVEGHGTDDVLRCMGGCGTAYRDFDLDVVLPDDQWAVVSRRTDGGGVMCAACIVRRGAQLPGVTVALLRFPDLEAEPSSA